MKALFLALPLLFATAGTGHGYEVTHRVWCEGNLFDDDVNYINFKLLVKTKGSILIVRRASDDKKFTFINTACKIHKHES